MANVAGARVEGATKLLKQLDDLAKRQAISINRRAVNIATTPILRASKDECPVQEGDLRRSLAKKVYNKGQVAGGIVGVDRGYIVQDGERITKDEKTEDGVRKIPNKYDHLVEFGHVTPDGTYVAANPFLARAAADSLPDAQEQYEQLLKDGIEKALDSK